MATKALGQDAKDKAGQAEMDARRAAEHDPAAARREALAGLRAAWVPDDQLEGLGDLELFAEAKARGARLAQTVTRGEVVEACRAVTAELDRPAEGHKPLAKVEKGEAK